MNETAILNLINTYIVANGVNAITADVLRPILVAMLEQPNDKVGELDDLSTTNKSSVVEAINELASSSNSGFTIHTGTADPNTTPPTGFSIGDWYVRGGTSLYQYNGNTWVLLNDTGTSTTDDISFIDSPLSNIPVSTNDLLTTIIQNIDTALGDRYTKTESDNRYIDSSELIDSSEIDLGNKLLVFKDSTGAELFSQDITEFVSQGVSIEVAGSTLQLKDSDGNILSTATLPITNTISIDSNEFDYVVGSGNSGTTIEVGDIAKGGLYTYNSTLFFGDLICIDDTGDLTTGVGTKWEILTATEIAQTII